jgi:hypothetical protein
MNNNNPHSICTWDNQSQCSSCGIQGKLACRWDKKILHGFHGIAWPPLSITVFSMVVVGLLAETWWPLIAYLIYFFLMFGIFEIRFLCSHCPYYAEEGKVLHCLANHGSFKLWKYHPGPLNKFEKFMMIFLVVTIFFGFPLAVQGYGIWYIATNFSQYGIIALMGMIGLAGANLLSSMSFMSTLKTFYCPSCVNFSCPLNKVSKPVVDAYLEKNDVMRKAWVKSGWHID